MAAPAGTHAVGTFTAGIGVIGLDPALRRGFGDRLVRCCETDDREPFQQWMREHMLTRIPEVF